MPFVAGDFSEEGGFLEGDVVEVKALAQGRRDEGPRAIAD
jgi:hypothetical protein